MGRWLLVVCSDGEVLGVNAGCFVIERIEGNPRHVSLRLLGR